MVSSCYVILGDFLLYVDQQLGTVLDEKRRHSMSEHRESGSVADIKKVQREEPLQAPIRPPHKRLWRAALVAPFAANTALVLHKCTADNAAGAKYFVQALHNEKPVIMPVSNHPFQEYFSFRHLDKSCF